jgi:hypothetical protein
MWWKHLKRLVAWDEESSKVDLFDRISRLGTGECVVLCPLALTGGSENGAGEIRRLGRGCMIVKMRKKVTVTVGESVLSIKV